MGGIIRTSMQFRFLVAVFAAALTVTAIRQARHMPIDVLPEFAPPHVEIQTEALGLSAEEVEQMITVPLEQHLLNGVAWLDTIRSESVAGLSSVLLVFERGTDLYRARQMVAERLAQAATTLPRVSRGPVMLQPKSAASRVLMVGLSSKTLSAIEMSVLARWTITPRLMGVPGVANVAVWGMRDRQLQVQVEPERLHAYNVPLLQVVESVANALWVSSLSFVEAASPGSAGFIDTPQQRLGIQHISPFLGAKQLAEVTIQGRGTFLVNEGAVDMSGRPVAEGAVRLRDVARVVESHPPLIGDALTGHGTNLLLVIEKLPGSDTADVTRGLEAAFAELQPGLGDMQVDTTAFRPATYVESATHTLAWALAVACLAVVLATGLLFRSVRAAAVGLIAMSVSLAAAALVLRALGATINLMVMAGLTVACGAIVDDAVADVAHVMRRLRHRGDITRGDTDGTSAGAIVEALTETRGAMAFAGLICLLAVLPFLAFRGTAGAALHPLIVSYALAVMASALVALIVTPALCTMLLPRDPGALSGPYAAPPEPWLLPGYDRFLTRFLSQPRAVWMVVAVLAAIGLGTLPLFRPTLLPAFQERDIGVFLDAAPGTSQPEMTRIVDRVRRELSSLPGIRNVNAIVGRAVFGDRVTGMNSAEIWASMSPGADYEATLESIRTVAAGYPGLGSRVCAYLDRIGSRIGAETDAETIVRLYGQDWTTLSDKAGELRQALAKVQGVGGSRVQLPVEEPTVEVQVDLASAQRHGVSPGAVRRAAATLINGVTVGCLFQEQKVFDVVVWSTPETRGSLTDIRNLLVDTPFFKVPVRLGDVARVSMVPRPTLVRHEGVSRYLDIALEMEGHAGASVRRAIREQLRSFRFPLEYHAELLDAGKERRAARARCLGLVAVALLGMVLLLQSAFESWRLALLSLLTMPLALAGGPAALALAGGQGLTFGTLPGLLAVLGIAVRGQVMLIRRLRQAASAAASEAGGPDAAVRAVREQAVPVLTTALTLAGGLAPFLCMGHTPGVELLRPIATVIVGGIVTATVVTLAVVPALYLRLAGTVADRRR